MSAATHDRDLLARAQELIAADRYGELVSLTSKAAANAPATVRSTLLHAQLVALIRLERYQDALRLLDTSQTLATRLPYERAYCLYRTNKLTDALAVLDTLDANDRKVQLLKAQVLYRLERFPECLAIYESLLDQTPEDEDEELRQDLITNHQAVVASSYLSTLSFSSPEQDTDAQDALTELAHFTSYEHCYNTATTALAQGHLPLAKAALDHARRLATLTLADSGLSQRDLALELQPVLVQLAYAHHVAGELLEAAELYRMVIGGAGGAPATHTPDWAVAVNNLASIEAVLAAAGKEEDSNNKGEAGAQKDLQRKFKKIHKHAAVRSDRMPRWQRQVVVANEALVNGFAAPASAAVAADLDTAGELDERANNIVLQTMRALATGKPLPDAADTTNPLSRSVFVTLAHIQRTLESTPAASASSPDTLAAVLAEHHPTAARVPALAALHARTLFAAGQTNAAVAILDAVGTLDAREQVARMLGHVPERHPEAAEVWAQVVAQDPGNARRVAEWVKAEALVDPEAAEEHAVALPAVEDHEDQDQDEDPDTAWKTLVATPAAAAAAAAPAKEKDQAPRRLRRRPRYPKGVDPTSPEFVARVPDPERWVPKHLRAAALAAAKKKADKAAKRGGKATLVASSHQGGPIADDPNPAPVMTGLGGTGSARIFGNRGGQGQAKEQLEKEEPGVVQPVAPVPSKPAAGGKKKGAGGKKGGRK